MKICPLGMLFWVKESWFMTLWKAKCCIYLTLSLNLPTIPIPICRQQQKNYLSLTLTLNGTNLNFVNNKELSTFTNLRHFLNHQTPCILMKFSWKRKKNSIMHSISKRTILKPYKWSKMRSKKLQENKGLIEMKS